MEKLAAWMLRHKTAVQLVCMWIVGYSCHAGVVLILKAWQ